MPVTEKIGLSITLVAAIILIGFSFFSLIIDIILQFDLYGIAIDLIFLAIGILVGYFSFRIYNKSVYYEGLVSSAFDEGIYTRLEPVLRKVAETHVEMEDLEGRIDKIDHMVQTVIDEQVKTEKHPGIDVEKTIAPGTSMGFLAKTIILAMISMSGFMLLIEILFGMAHLVILLFYVLWWLHISSEFKVFDKTTTWVALFVPIILIPFSIMFLNIAGLFALDDLIGIFYALLALYAFLYYSWAVYETKGTLPFNLDFRIYIKHK